MARFNSGGTDGGHTIILAGEHVGQVANLRADCQSAQTQAD